MKTQLCCDNLILFSVLTAGLLLSSAVFVLPALAAEGEPSAEQINAALQDLSAATGQTIGTKEAALQVCDSEKYFTVCAGIGKKHDLYSLEEIKQVDDFVSEIKGNIADRLQSCQTTECLISVANDLARKLNTKAPTSAVNLDLTPKIVEKKQAVISAAKDLGVDYEACRKMDPDTASIELLRGCAKLAKDSRVRDVIPEGARQSAEAFGEYSDKMVEFRAALAAGKYQCGDNTLNGCGNFCLNPSKEARVQGTAIPPVCRVIAKRFFGPEGEKQLEAAYTQVGEAHDFYLKKAESVIFKTQDGKTLTSLEDIGDYMEQQGKQGNIEAVEKGMDFMIAKGFVKPEEKEYVLKFVRQVRDRGGISDFDSCRLNPESCRDFIPKEHIAEFEVHTEIEQIMKQEIGFDPSECEKGRFDPAIGQKCFEGSKKALSKLQSLRGKSKEAGFIVAEIERHIAQGEEFDKRKNQQVFQDQGGPGGCKSEQECFTFCSNPTNTPECISFGAKQGIFRGNEAVEKFQEFNNSLESQQLPTTFVKQFEQRQFQRENYPDSGFQPFGQGGQFPGQGPFPGFQPPGQGGFPPGQIPGFPGPGFQGGIQFGGPGPGPVGPSPECFAAIQSGDFARAKVVCNIAPVQIDFRAQPISTNVPPPPGVLDFCPKLPTVDSCPSGYVKVVSFSSPECGTYYSCQYQGGETYSPPPQPIGCPAGSYYDGRYSRCVSDQEGCALSGGTWDEANHYCRTGTYSPYPTGGTFTPYPTYSPGSTYTFTPPPACPSGQWWDYTYKTCTSATPSPSCPAGQWWDYIQNKCSSSASPYPTTVSGCSSSLINLLGSGCHWMYSDVSGKGIYCDGAMTKSAKEGDAVTSPGCTGGTYTYSPAPTYTYSPYPTTSPGGTYSPYPTPTSNCPSGSHSMGSYCMSDSDGTKCGPFGSTDVSSFGSCSSYQTTYTPYPTGGTYSPYPTYSPGGTYTYTPYPTTSYTPYPTCTVAGEWWDPATSSCKSSTAVSYTPYPTTTYTYTPPPTCSSGQYWNGTACVTTETTPYPTYSATPFPTTESTPPPTSLRAHHLAVANAVNACFKARGVWDPQRYTCTSAKGSGFFANVLKIFSKFVGFR